MSDDRKLDLAGDPTIVAVDACDGERIPNLAPEGVDLTEWILAADSESAPAGVRLELLTAPEGEPCQQANGIWYHCERGEKLRKRLVTVEADMLNIRAVLSDAGVRCGETVLPSVERVLRELDEARARVAELTRERDRLLAGPPRLCDDCRINYKAWAGRPVAQEAAEHEQDWMSPGDRAAFERAVDEAWAGDDALLEEQRAAGVPPGPYAKGGRSPIVWVLLCPVCAGFAPLTAEDYEGFLSGQCVGCGAHVRELHRFRAWIDSAAGCHCTGSHPRVVGDVAVGDREVIEDGDSNG